MVKRSSVVGGARFKKSRKATEHYLILMKALYLHDPNRQSLKGDFLKKFCHFSKFSIGSAVALKKVGLKYLI